MRTTEPAQRHDRLALRLSVIISQLLASESLSLKALSDEFGVSERTLRRDFHQRLLHLDITGDNGTWRLRTSPMRDHIPDALAFACNTGIACLIPSQNKQLMQLLMDENGTSLCLIGHAEQPAGILPDCFQRLVEGIYHQRMVRLLVKGILHDHLEPYRLIHSLSHWYSAVYRQLRTEYQSTETETAVRQDFGEAAGQVFDSVIDPLSLPSGLTVLLRRLRRKLVRLAMRL